MAIPINHTLEHYTEGGIDLFVQWLDTVTDKVARGAIASRLMRLELGLFGV